VNGGYQEEDLVNDGWTEIIGRLLLIATKERKKGASKADAARLMQMADYEKMESIRKRAEDVVKDRATAEALKPWYNQFCKRPCFHDEYLDTFNRPNVKLIDTDGKGVERITEHGIVANGLEYKVDCLIYSTGFEVGTSFTRRSGYEVYGRDGLALSDKWKDGVSTLHSFMSRGFPNCLMVSNAQGAATANFTQMIEEQSRHIAYIIDSARKRNAATIEPSEEGEAEWVKTIETTAIVRRRFFEECTPGYYNNEGQPNNALARRNGTFGAGPIAFVKLLEDWRAAGQLEGLELN